MSALSPLSGVKQTLQFQRGMSAVDPKQTWKLSIAAVQLNLSSHSAGSKFLL
jgi:hypothetical protein